MEILLLIPDSHMLRVRIHYNVIKLVKWYIYRNYNTFHRIFERMKKSFQIK